MQTGIFELPNAIQTDSGEWVREIELAEMTGMEEDILADQTRLGGKGHFAKSVTQRMTEILSRCTVRLGSHARPEGKDRFTAPLYFAKAWDNAYSNDRVYALMRLRQVSLGDKLVFPDTCPECKKEIKRVSVDLNDLEVQTIDFNTACMRVRQVKLPRSGDTVDWRPLTAQDEPVLEEIARDRKSDFLSAFIFQRIMLINGSAPPKGVEYVKKMGQYDRRFLNSYFDTAEGGIDTSIGVVCDSCATEFRRKVNVGDQSFFFPSEV